MQVLLVLILDFHFFKVFSLEDLAAIETFHVVNPISAGDHLGAGMVTSGLHNRALMKFILPMSVAMSSPHPQVFGTAGAATAARYNPR
jgi:hypothetical protein